MSAVVNNAPLHLVLPDGALRSRQPLGRLCFVPGSRGRAEAIAAHFSEVSVYPNPRGHDVYVGRLNGALGPVDVAAVHTGMGAPSVDIIVSELIWHGVRRFMRVGTAGALQPSRVKVDDVVIATGAVRDEGTSHRYAPIEFPAIASTFIVRHLCAATERLGLEQHAHAGIVHTKDSLLAREFGAGPMADESQKYMALMGRLGVLASEMEASHLFVLAHAHSASADAAPIHAGAILAIAGEGDHALPEAESGEARAVAIALEAARLMGSAQPGPFG